MNKNQTIVIIYFLSGIAGLAYQVIWVKLFSHMFGHTIYSVSTVTAVFMSGMAFGSYLFGKIADKNQNPLRIYALVEFGIGVYAVLLIFALPFLNEIYSLFFRAWELEYSSLSFSRIIFTTLILLIPTSFIGGTFPVISKYYITDIENVRIKSGILYGVNTLGAVLGALMAGFYFIENIGLRCTIYSAASLNILLALITLIISAGLKSKSQVITNNNDKREYKNRFILYIYAVCGFASLSLEVLWTRELSIVFFSSTYSFTVVLAVFLTGLVAGSLLVSRLKIGYQKIEQYFFLLLLILAFCAFVSLPLLRIIPQKFFIEVIALREMTWQRELITYFIISFSVLILPTLIMGAMFPLACAMYTRKPESLSKNIGEVYAFNTAGAVLGSLIAGFILIPSFGVSFSIGIISVIYIIVAIIFLFITKSFKYRIVYSFALLIVSFIFFLFFSYDVNFRPLPANTKVLFSKEDVNAEVKVLSNYNNERSLYINEKQQGGTHVEQTERWAGEIPLLFHNKPDSVLLIGLGTGVTLNALAQGKTKHIDCAELVGSIYQAIRYFNNINDNILHNEKVDFIEADGINYLNLTDHKYDLILSDIVQPDDAGAAALYAQEFYQLSRNKLKSNGFLAQWIILDQLDLSELKIIINTFRHVYPEMLMFFGQETNRYMKLLLIGPKNKFNFDLDKFEERFRQFEHKDNFNGKADTYSFLSNFITTGNNLNFDETGIPVNTYDRPVLEFSSPRHKWKEMKSLENINYLKKQRKNFTDIISVRKQEESLFDKYYNARRFIIDGLLNEMANKYEMAEEFYLKAGLFAVDTVFISYRLSVIAWRYFQKNQVSKAVETYKKALAVNHKNVLASKALGDLLFKMDKISEAKQFYKYTVSIDSTDFEVYRRLGDIYTEERDFDNAFYAYGMSVLQNENQPVLHFILGQIYLNHKKNVNAALKHFNRSLELDPNHRYSQQVRKILRNYDFDIRHN